jgi:CDP-diacylglycerol---glycerol-3-phosphate 3-phosphatidyltransferase
MAGSAAAQGPAAGPRLLNIPNALTVTRLALVPVFVAFLAAGGTEWRILAFFVFGVASATDLLDGELARRSGMITDFGKIADPIADKALTGSALVTLSALGELSWWVTGVIIVREVGVTLLRFWVIRHGVIPASRGGKIKTVLQMLAIGLYILPIHIGWVRPAIMGAAVAVTLVTGADYVVRAIRLRRIAADLTVPAADPVAAADADAAGSDAAGPEAAGLDAAAQAAAQAAVSPPAETGPGG